jgi:hypothetical protein
MLVFLDTEFTDFYKPELISLALVAENGLEFYAERTDFDQSKCSAFVIETVLPLLGRIPGADCQSDELANRLRAWMEALPEPAIVIFDYGDDWTLLAKAWLGTVHQAAPANVCDKLHLDMYAVTHPIFERELNRVYTQDWPPHHALADARALMAGYRAWRVYMEPIWRIQ